MFGGQGLRPVLARFPVFAQIAAGFALGAILLAGAATVTYARVAQMRVLAGQAIALQQVSTIAGDVLTQMLEAEAAVRGYAGTRDSKFLIEAKIAADRARDNVAALQAAGQTRALPSNRLEQIVIATQRIDDDVAHVSDAFAEIERVSARGRSTEIADRLRAEPAVFEKLRHDRGVLLAYTSSGAQAALIQLDATRRHAAFTLIVSTICAILLFGLAAAATARNIAGRLRVVTSALGDITHRDVPAVIAAFGKLATGDLSARYSTPRAPIAMAGNDEIAALAGSYDALVNGLHDISAEFDDMTRRLRAAIDVVDDSAAEIAGSSDAASGATLESQAAISQIYNAVRRVADASTRQIESISAARSQIQELNYSARLIAESAEFLTGAHVDLALLPRVAQRNAYIAQDLRESVGRLLHAMLTLEQSAGEHAGLADAATEGAAELCRKLSTIDLSSRVSMQQSQSLRALASAFTREQSVTQEVS